MKITRILLYYSLLCSIFLVLSGILTVKSAQDVLYLVFISPVLAYFVLTITKVYKTEDRKIKPKFLVPIVIVPVLLSILAFLRTQNRPEQENVEPVALETAKPTQEPEPVEFKITGTGTKVNVRENPSITAEIIDTVEVGAIFEETETSGGWYKVATGWVYKDFVKILE